MEFTKMHGLGNDFVIVNGCRETIPSDYCTLAKKVCDRHFGVGADGLVFILPSERADVRMRIFNSDGSEAEMCGNVIRCVAKYLYEREIVKGVFIRVETLAGIMMPEVILENGRVTGARVDMGEPILERQLIPMLGDPGRAVNEPIIVNGKELRITAVSMGNPHCLVFVPQLDKIPFRVWGPEIEHHPLFPRKTNVEFIEVINPNEIRVKVWERGVGETLACGTGACACVVGGVLNGKTGREVVVHLPGGRLNIEWAKNGRVYMTGPATEVFSGTLFLENL
ncbi:MAG: diaminopimelate epimerase [Firmicutes bacterium]|nr:diaminopimelate epimerase [Bacillota bacterium]